MEIVTVEGLYYANLKAQGILGKHYIHKHFTNHLAVNKQIFLKH